MRFKLVLSAACALLAASIGLACPPAVDAYHAAQSARAAGDLPGAVLGYADCADLAPFAPLGGMLRQVAAFVPADQLAPYADFADSFLALVLMFLGYAP